MNYILDCFFILIFFLGIIVGYKRGLIKSLSRLVSNIIAVISAKAVSTSFAPKVYENYFEGKITNIISQKLTSTGGDVSAKIKSAVDAIPESMDGFITMVGLDKQQIASSIKDGVSKSGDNLCDILMNNFVSPVATFVIRMIIFVICFSVIALLLGIIIKLLSKLTKLPIIKQADGLFGLAFGGIKSVITIVFLCVVIELLAGFIKSDGLIEIIEGSKILPIVTKFVGELSL